LDINEAQGAIRALVNVTPQRVVIAKAVIIRSIGGGAASAQSLLQAVVRAADVVIPEQLILHSSVDVTVAVRAIAEGFSWKLAAIEAICSLVGSGALIADSNHWSFNASVGWTTVAPGGGSGTSSGFDFPELSFPVPGNVRRAPSLARAEDLYLSDPDLYLNMLAIPSMHADIQAALREAIRCFRAELWLAAVAMLGKASEGGWIELGTSLLAAAGPARSAMFAKQRDALDDPMMGPAKKIESVLTIFDRQDVFKPLTEASGIKNTQLRATAQWSDTVRDSRNTLHFLVSAATPNTYDKVGVLLLGGAQPFRTLYALKAVADSTQI